MTDVKTWGPMTIERHTELQNVGVHLRVFVRGEDVTERCRYADDTPGQAIAELFRLNQDECKYLDEDGEPAMEVVREQIEFHVRHEVVCPVEAVEDRCDVSDRR